MKEETQSILTPIYSFSPAFDEYIEQTKASSSGKTKNEVLINFATGYEEEEEEEEEDTVGQGQPNSHKGLPFEPLALKSVMINNVACSLDISDYEGMGASDGMDILQQDTDVSLNTLVFECECSSALMQPTLIPDVSST